MAMDIAPAGGIQPQRIQAGPLKHDDDKKDGYAGSGGQQNGLQADPG